MELLVPIFLGTALMIVIAAWAAMVIYVYLSAERLGMSRPWLWALGVFFTGLLGLIAFLIDRPNARLVPCAHCRRTIPEGSPCPYCGAPPP